MAVKMFQGNDRRLLKKAKQLLNAIKARDVKAGGTKPTSAISNRMLILQEGGSADNQAVTLLLTRFDTLLATTKP